MGGGWLLTRCYLHLYLLSWLTHISEAVAGGWLVQEVYVTNTATEHLETISSVSFNIVVGTTEITPVLWEKKFFL